MLSTKQEVNGSPNLIDAFQVYQLPLDISQDYIDPVDGHVHRFQTKCLGKCSLKFGNRVYPQVTFFEITESEINNKEEEIIETTTTSTTTNEILLKGLPPKKRKRRRMIRYDIIFTVDKGLVTLSSDHVFFILSRDAVTECLTHVAPHKLLISFFTPSSCHGGMNCVCPPMMEEGNPYKTKLEEFAAVCITSCKLQQQQVDSSSSSSSHVNNMILSSVSHELYVAIKQMVSSYELLCQNMTELMKLHKDQVVHHKAEMDFLPETAISLPNQSDDEFLASSKHHDDWSSSSDEQDNMKEDEPQEVTTAIPRKLSKSSIQQQQQQQKGRGNNASNQIKKCLYCGSKSTPMWRRGPQGAGTLCNACGVKWKHGKILNGSGNNNNDMSMDPIQQQQQQQRRNSNTKGEKKRKRSNASTTKRVTKKRATSITDVPAPPQWEAASSSTTSDSRSPLESFSSSPNTSPSITTLMDGQTDMKRDILMSYDTETLSVYVGEDAVEAAAVLTLLKRS